MLGQEAVGIAQIAKETGLTRQTVYRIKGDPAGAECPFRNFLNRLNQLDFKGGGLIRGGVADVDA